MSKTIPKNKASEKSGVVNVEVTLIHRMPFTDLVISITSQFTVQYVIH